MKKLLSLSLSAGILVASMAMIATPATAIAAPQVTSQAHDSAVKSKAKSKAKKAKHAKQSKKIRKSKHKKNTHASSKK